MVTVDTTTLVNQFLASGQEYPLVVYDVDDVLWDLIGRVAQRAHIPYQSATAIFSIRDNQLLTLAQQDTIIAAFSNPEIFRDIAFYEGTADILRPRELGAKVRINSNSFNQAIADFKREQLLRAIPGLTEADIQMNIIDYSKTHSKKFIDGMTILVDDSSHNVAQSPALVNVMPMSVPWSYSESALQMVATKTTVWKPDLKAVNEYVYTLVSQLMQARNT